MDKSQQFGRARTRPWARSALDEVSAAIAAAVEEQSVVIREMLGSMHAAAHGIASGMEAIARASEQIDTTTRQVPEAARVVS